MNKTCLNCKYWDQLSPDDRTAVCDVDIPLPPWAVLSGIPQTFYDDSCSLFKKLNKKRFDIK